MAETTQFEIHLDASNFLQGAKQAKQSAKEVGSELGKASGIIDDAVNRQAEAMVGMVKGVASNQEKLIKQYQNAGNRLGMLTQGSEAYARQLQRIDDIKSKLVQNQAVMAKAEEEMGDYTRKTTVDLKAQAAAEITLVENVKKTINELYRQRQAMAEVERAYERYGKKQASTAVTKPGGSATMPGGGGGSNMASMAAVSAIVKQEKELAAARKKREIQEILANEKILEQNREKVRLLREQIKAGKLIDKVTRKPRAAGIIGGGGGGGGDGGPPVKAWVAYAKGIYRASTRLSWHLFLIEQGTRQIRIFLGGLLKMSAEGARLTDLERAFNNLNASVKTGGVNLESLNSALAGTVSRAKQIELANLGMNLGIGGADIPKLAQIAKAAAQTLGTSTEAMYGDIVRGTARRSKKILDNLGIRMEDLSTLWRITAKRLGKSVRDLTEEEKNQAFIQQVLANSSHILAASGRSNADAYDQLSASAQNTIDSFKILFDKTLRQTGALQSLNALMKEIEPAGGAVAEVVARIARYTKGLVNVIRFVNALAEGWVAAKDAVAGYVNEAMKSVGLEMGGAGEATAGDAVTGFLTGSMESAADYGYDRLSDVFEYSTEGMQMMWEDLNLLNKGLRLTKHRLTEMMKEERFLPPGFSSNLEKEGRAAKAAMGNYVRSLGPEGIDEMTAKWGGEDGPVGKILAQIQKENERLQRGMSDAAVGEMAKGPVMKMLQMTESGRFSPGVDAEQRREALKTQLKVMRTLNKEHLAAWGAEGLKFKDGIVEKSNEMLKALGDLETLRKTDFDAAWEQVAKMYWPGGDGTVQDWDAYNALKESFRTNGVQWMVDDFRVAIDELQTQSMSKTDEFSLNMKSVARSFRSSGFVMNEAVKDTATKVGSMSKWVDIISENIVKYSTLDVSGFGNTYKDIDNAIKAIQDFMGIGDDPKKGSGGRRTPKKGDFHLGWMRWYTNQAQGTLSDILATTALAEQTTMSLRELTLAEASKNEYFVDQRALYNARFDLLQEMQENIDRMSDSNPFKAIAQASQQEIKELANVKLRQDDPVWNLLTKQWDAEIPEIEKAKDALKDRGKQLKQMAEEGDENLDKLLEHQRQLERMLEARNAINALRKKLGMPLLETAQKTVEDIGKHGQIVADEASENAKAWAKLIEDIHQTYSDAVVTMWKDTAQYAMEYGFKSMLGDGRMTIDELQEYWGAALGNMASGFGDNISDAIKLAIPRDTMLGRVGGGLLGGLAGGIFDAAGSMIEKMFKREDKKDKATLDAVKRLSEKERDITVNMEIIHNGLSVDDYMAKRVHRNFKRALELGEGRL